MASSLERFLPLVQHRPYRASLEPGERAVYDAVLQGALAYDAAIPLSTAPAPEFLQELLTFIKLDVPELFFVDGFAMMRAGIAGRSVVRPSYRFDFDAAEAHLLAMERRANEVLEPVANHAVERRIRACHDWLVGHVAYADEAAAHSHEAPGALLFGVGVCEGVAKAMKCLCDRAGIRAMVAVGRSREPSSGSAELDPHELHAWNIVDFGDGWKHVDVTYDGGLSTSVVRYDYFGLSDEEAAVDHELDPRWPSCPMPLGYYRASGRFAASRSELERMARAAVVREEDPFVFQMPLLEGDGAKRIESEIGPLVVAAFRDSRDGAARAPIALACNPNRMVFQVDRTLQTCCKR